MNEITLRSCAAITRSGNPCKNNAVQGSAYCHVHREISQIEETGAEVIIVDQETKAQLTTELDELISQVKEEAPEYTPPPFSPQQLMRLVEENLHRFSPKIQLGILEKLRGTINEDYFDIDTWKGIWYMLNYSLEYQTDFVKRRLRGEYETDEWGLDMEVLDRVRPYFEFMYNNYWRVETTGIEHIPDDGAAMLVANHSGQLPWDGAMLGVAVYNEHPYQRLVRNLYATWFPTLPFVSSMFTKLGQVLATEDNGTRLLDQGEVVSVFPEGIKGVSKLYKDRYRLARFGRGGFVRMALKTGAPIIPVSIVGAEETYVTLAKSPTIANMIGFPFFPISLRFPWLGPLGVIPLPTKWYIDIGEPIPMDVYGDEAEHNLVLVSQLTDQIRNVVQQMVFLRLAQRKSVFLG